MEDFVVDQARYLSRILAANAKHIEEKRVTTEHYSVHPMSVMDHAEILQIAVGDSVTLHKEYPHAHQFVVSKSEFSLLQNQLLGLALQDRARLQDVAADTVMPEMLSIRPQFVLEVAKILESVVLDNAQVATEGNFDINKLDMCKPWEVAKLVARLRHLLEYHIRHLDELTSSKRKADDLVVQLRKQNEDVTAQHTAAQGKVTELEGALVASVQRIELIKTALEAAEASTLARVDGIRKEYELFKSAHLQCANQIQERDSEIVQLREECKILIKSYEERVEAANDSDATVSVKVEELELVQMERDKLATKLSELQASYEHFRLLRGEETEQLVKEKAQLQEALQKQVDASEIIEDRNTQLRREVSRLESELRATQTQLMGSEVQCDTWKVTVDDILSRHAEELEVARNNTAQERELREAGDGLLQNAARKIEELEVKGRMQDQEIARLRVAVAQKNDEMSQRLPISPPPSAHKSGPSSSRKRKAPAASWSQDDNGFALNLAAHGSPIPVARAAVLASLPAVPVNLGESPEIFTRQSLSNILGGSVQGLVVRCTNSATDLARRYDMTDYLCPNMDHNAWSPPGPGQHGYMQVGLGRDRKLFNGEGEYRHVFVGGGKFFLYCGWYHVLRVDPLTKEEWDTLPTRVKTTYSETTFNKENTKECTNKQLWSTIKSADQVLTMYNKGELRAPLVRLQCLKFDMDFYQELVDANGRYFTNKARPAPPNVAKRRKAADDASKAEDDKEDDMPLTMAEEKAEDDHPPMPPNDSATSAAAGPSEDAMAPNSTEDVSMGDAIAAAPAPSSSEDASMDASVATPAPVSVASASIVLPPSSPARQARYGTRQQSSVGLVRLRIPGGRSPRSHPDAKDTEDEREVEDRLSSSGLSSASDDDDMYAD